MPYDDHEYHIWYLPGTDHQGGCQKHARTCWCMTDGKEPDPEVDCACAAKVYLWENGMLMVFGLDGRQVPDLQGRDSLELREKIRVRAVPEARWHGFGPEGPCVWNPPLSYETPDPSIHREVPDGP